jgi:hypothetical protein
VRSAAGAEGRLLRGSPTSRRDIMSKMKGI